MGRQALEVGELSKTVAKLLESARDEQGVSYRELQQRSGINRMRAQRILTEERPFTVDEVDEIAQALGLVGWKVVREAASMVSPTTAPENVSDRPVTVDEHTLAADTSPWEDEQPGGDDW